MFGISGGVKSPVADCQMEVVQLEPGLYASKCPASGGIFLSAEAYWRWKRKHPKGQARIEVSPDWQPEEEDSKQAKLCPLSGSLMLRYRVGHGFDFSLDRSSCGNLWFDKGEWEALQNHQLHDELHLIFTTPWQQRVRAHQAEVAERQWLEKKLGADLLLELDQLKESLKNHPNKEMAIAYFPR